jgi:poly(3-hydroxybutyrate) depolymerase
MTSRKPWSFTPTGHYTISTLGRVYLAHIPPSYTPDIAYPLVLSFHGHGSTPEEQESITGFSKPGLKINNTEIVAVYPQGLPDQEGKQLAWQGAPYAAAGVDDVSTVTAAVLFVMKTSVYPRLLLCIDCIHSGNTFCCSSQLIH